MSALPQPAPEPQISAEELLDLALLAFADHLACRNFEDSNINNGLMRIRAITRTLEIFPWAWEHGDYEQFQAARRAANIATSTRRLDQYWVTLFCSFLADPNYRFRALCTALTGQAPIVPVSEANRILHVEAHESAQPIIPPTTPQLRRILCCGDELAKSSLLWYRNVTWIKNLAAYGLRNSEGCEVEGRNYSRVLTMPQYGDVGQVYIPNGKAKPRGPKRERTVLTVPHFDWIVPVIATYKAEVRPLFNHADVEALFINASGTPLDPRYMARLFRELVAEAEVPTYLHPHSLRHYFITQLIKRHYVGHFVSRLAGHEHEGSTGRYVHYDEEFVQSALLGAQEEWPT